jgi:hypothetical protein
VSALHNLFKEKLRAAQKKIDLEAVIRYVNGLNDTDLANMTKVHKLELKPVTEAPVAADVAVDATPVPPADVTSTDVTA